MNSKWDQAETDDKLEKAHSQIPVLHKSTHKLVYKKFMIYWTIIKRTSYLERLENEAITILYYQLSKYFHISVYHDLETYYRPISLKV